MSEILADEKLIHQYLKGDEISLEFLIARYLGIIYSFVYKNVGNTDNAEDITQEVFVKVWKNIKKFDQERSFRPWIFQIAKNASIDFLRRKKAIPFSRFESDTGHNPLVENIIAAPLDLIGKISDRRVLAAAMQGLGDKEREVINLRYEGLNFREIAENVKESINTVKSRYRRCIIDLKKNIRNN